MKKVTDDLSNMTRIQDQATSAPSKEDAISILAFVKAIRSRTKDWCSSILSGCGVGSFRQDNERPFNRSLLFNKSVAGSLVQLYSPQWLGEIKRCHLSLWSVADKDTEVGGLYNYMMSFKHDWEDFFQELSARFPNDAANLISDFEYAGLEMFGNFEAAVISANANISEAEMNCYVFLAYLPEVKKLFIKETQDKSTEGAETQQGNDVERKKMGDVSCDLHGTALAETSGNSLHQFNAADIDLNAENERRHREIMDRLNHPLTAVFDGYTAHGKQEAVMVVNTKPRETNYLSDANLRILFEVSENTPYNWRTGKATAPEGFAEAFEKKDYAAMQKCAERYKANRGKNDALRTKGVVRNISDEQMRKMGAKMPDGRCGEPQ